jgi:hypothetical protein
VQGSIRNEKAVFLSKKIFAKKTFPDYCAAFQPSLRKGAFVRKFRLVTFAPLFEELSLSKEVSNSPKKIRIIN